MSTNYLMFGEETLQVYKEEADNNQLIRDRILANNKAIQQIQTQLNEDVKRAIEGKITKTCSCNKKRFFKF